MGAGESTLREALAASGPFRAWLEAQPESRTFDPRDPFGCPLRTWLHETGHEVGGLDYFRVRIAGTTLPVHNVPLCLWATSFQVSIVFNLPNGESVSVQRCLHVLDVVAPKGAL